MPIIGADPNPVFMPAVRDIANITNAVQAEVTTTFAHGYVNDIICRIWITPPYGMTQINYLFAPITVTGATTFLIDIDTTNFDVFVTPAPVDGVTYTVPQCVPIGEETRTLLGSFVNVLPPI